MSKSDGGQAFPGQEFSGAGGAASEMQYGMTLRDWFAGQALAGFSANPTFDITAEQAASWSWQQADAMLKERDSDA